MRFFRWCVKYVSPIFMRTGGRRIPRPTTGHPTGGCRSRKCSGCRTATEGRCSDAFWQVHLVAREERRRRLRLTRGQGDDALVTDGGPSCVRTMSCGRRLVRHPTPRRTSAIRWQRGSEEISGSSGSKKRRPKTERHAQDQSADEDPPSPSLASFLEQNLDVPLWWVPSGAVENGLLWL
jgi:hypothetical protein